MQEHVARVKGLRIVHKICVRKPEGKKENLGNFSVGQVKKNSYSIKETVSAGVTGIQLVQDRVKG